MIVCTHCEQEIVETKPGLWKRRDIIYGIGGSVCGRVNGHLQFHEPPNFRQSPSLTQSGAESVHSGKQNTADKSELLPTQLDQEPVKLNLENPICYDGVIIKEVKAPTQLPKEK